jgi:hypothetical protein
VYTLQPTKSIPDNFPESEVKGYGCFLFTNRKDGFRQMINFAGIFLPYLFLG